MIRPLIAGNWKMNLNLGESVELAKHVEKIAAERHKEVDVAIFPSLLFLSSVSEVTDHAMVGVQNIYHADHGAFTGEVSPAQVGEYASMALIGHSERRHVFNEGDEMIARKMSAAVRNNLRPVLCVGETAKEREHGETAQVLNDQLSTGLTMLTTADMVDVVIAYEPVWAIGTGDHADPDDVTAAIAQIRSTMSEMFGSELAQAIRVLYGGSVNSDTAGGYLGSREVNGLLVGGASLKAEEFSAIVGKA